jgi:hypothetical protein
MKPRRTLYRILPVTAALLSLAAWALSAPESFQLALSQLKQKAAALWHHDRTVDKDGDEDGDKDGKGAREAEEDLEERKKRYAFRAYPAQTIPPGMRLKALRQFQALYPENQMNGSSAMGPVSPTASEGHRGH